MAKRMFDFFCSMVLLIVLFPALMIIACSIKATSRGPVLFKQKRMGYKGSVFTIFKFRTMLDGSGKPFDVVLKDDIRVTKSGKFLRQTHLDELPQLWNVLKGDMSFVGPRPTPLDIARNRIENVFGYNKRFDVRPGITGPTQIRGREWILMHRKTSLLLDINYISKQSFAEDLRIMLATVPVIIRRQGI